MPQNSETRPVETSSLVDTMSGLKDYLYIILQILLLYSLYYLYTDNNASPVKRVAPDLHDSCENGPLIEVDFGDTLHQIASLTTKSRIPGYSDYLRSKMQEEILRLNPHIGDGNIIFPGQYLVLPPQDGAAEYARERNQGRFPVDFPNSSAFLNEQFPDVASTLPQRASNIYRLITDANHDLAFAPLSRDYCIYAAYRYSDEDITPEAIEAVLADYEAWVHQHPMIRYWSGWSEFDAPRLNRMLEKAGVDERLDPNLYHSAVFIMKPDTVFDTYSEDSEELLVAAGETWLSSFFIWFNGNSALQRLPNTIDDWEDKWTNNFIRDGMQHELVHLIQNESKLRELTFSENEFLHSSLSLITLPIHEWDEYFHNPEFTAIALDPRVQFIFMKIKENYGYETEELYLRFIRAVITGEGTRDIISEYEWSRQKHGGPPFSELFNSAGPPNIETLTDINKYQRGPNYLEDFIELMDTANRLSIDS